jgi:Flp pilus assembly protein TadD
MSRKYCQILFIFFGLLTGFFAGCGKAHISMHTAAHPRYHEQNMSRVHGQDKDAPPFCAELVRLMDDAKDQMHRRKYSQAYQTVEKALGISPSDAELWSILAEIQLKRGYLGQAEQMARKSIQLEAHDKTLRANNFRIIAEARKRMGDIRGSTAAAEEMRKLTVK